MKLKNLVRPIYLARRIALKVYEVTHPGEPWFAAGAIRFCAQILTPDSTVLEWGSGRSTLWFARRCGKLLSVEHDALWQQKVQRDIVSAKISTAECRFVSLAHPENEPAKNHYEVLPRYVGAADEFPDNSLDLVIVDGHYRGACLIKALEKVRPGAYLLLDNSNWLPKLSDWPVPASWKVVHQSTNVLTQTTIWQKPKHV